MNYASHYSQALRYSAVTAHPNYDRDGINPDIHAVLTAIAAAPDDLTDAPHYPQSKENANVILGSGDTNLFPSLGAALQEEGHPLAALYPWDRLERGLKIDDALHSTRVYRRGTGGSNSELTDFGNLHPSRQLLFLADEGTHDYESYDQAAHAHRAIAENIRRAVPDASAKEIAHAVERASHKARLLKRDRAGEGVVSNYDDSLRRHLADPDYFAHPDTHVWKRHNHESRVVRLDHLLMLPESHARRYGATKKGKQ